MKLEPGSQSKGISAHKKRKRIVSKGNYEERVRRKLGKSSVGGHKRRRISNRSKHLTVLTAAKHSKIRNEKCSLALEIRRAWGPSLEDFG